MKNKTKKSEFCVITNALQQTCVWKHGQISLEIRNQTTKDKSISCLEEVLTELSKTGNLILLRIFLLQEKTQSTQFSHLVQGNV